jgi:hypothetical protein
MDGAIEAAKSLLKGICDPQMFAGTLILDSASASFFHPSLALTSLQEQHCSSQYPRHNTA